MNDSADRMLATVSQRYLATDAVSVQTHLQMLQGIIGRLASNSASCKAWCVSIVSALVVLAAGQSSKNVLLVAALPIPLFFALDGYYLGLERRFRACYDSFVRKLHAGNATIEDAFYVAPKQRVRGLFLEAFFALWSFSIWPFYVGIASILWLVSDKMVK